MELTYVARIIQEELSEAEARIIQRLSAEQIREPRDAVQSPAKPLPANENYAKALELYKKGGTHSGTAKELGVSMAQIKKYYTWLVKYGYLPIENAALSDVEQRVIDCIFKKKMSLRETAQELGCSISNVSYRRDSAFRKGYVPPEE